MLLWDFVINIWQVNLPKFLKKVIPEAHSEPCQSSRMKLLVTANSFGNS